MAGPGDGEVEQDAGVGGGKEGMSEKPNRSSERGFATIGNISA